MHLPHLFIHFFNFIMINKHNANPQETILTIIVGFLILSYIANLQWPLIVCIVIGVLGLFSNHIAIKINFFWMKLTWLLSKIIPNLILSLIFFLFLTPIALLSKIFTRKQPLILKKPSTSLFVTVNKRFKKSGFENPW